MDNEKTDKKQNKLSKIFTTKVIVVLLIVDVIVGTLLCVFRNSQIKRNIATELNTVTGSSISRYLLIDSSRKDKIISGVVTNIDVWPNYSTHGLEHKLKWYRLVVHVDSDGEDIPIVIDSDVNVYKVDEYGNVNSDTFSIGNSVEIYTYKEDGDATVGNEIIRNTSQEKYSTFQKMLSKVTTAELIADIISVLLISVIVCLIIYSIRNSTREYVELMIFIAISFLITTVISAMVINYSLREQKEIVTADKKNMLLPYEFNANYLAIDGIPELSNSGSDAIAMYEAFPDNIQSGNGYNVYEHPMPNDYLSVIESYHDEYVAHSGFTQRYSKIFGDNEYHAALYTFTTSQRALYEFDSYVDFCKDYEVSSEVFKNFYFDDDEMILYREIDVNSHGVGGHHDLVYVKLDDNAIVFYEFILKDNETATIERVGKILDEVGIDASKVEFLESLG